MQLKSRSSFVPSGPRGPPSPRLPPHNNGDDDLDNFIFQSILMLRLFLAANTRHVSLHLREKMRRFSLFIL